MSGCMQQRRELMWDRGMCPVCIGGENLTLSELLVAKKESNE